MKKADDDMQRLGENKCVKCGGKEGVLPTIKDYKTMETEYKCADCLIKELDEHAKL